MLSILLSPQRSTSVARRHRGGVSLSAPADMIAATIPDYLLNIVLSGWQSEMDKYLAAKYLGQNVIIVDFKTRSKIQLYNICPLTSKYEAYIVHWIAPKSGKISVSIVETHK